MKYIYFLLLLGFLFSCKKEVENNNTPVPVKDSELVLNATAAPFSPIVEGAKFYQDISYGDQSRNQFDIFLPESGTPTGLAIYIHGGGFTGGDKSIAYSNSSSQLFINQLLMQNIALATINYSFLSPEDGEGVLKSLKDSKRALQFIRYHAETLNIDKENIVLMGNSAGSGTSLWIALSDDMADASANDKVLRESTRVKGVVAAETQASYDILEWHSSVFYEYQPQGFSFETVKDLASEEVIMLFYGVNSMDELNSPKVTSDRQKLDFLNFLTADDPEILLDNSLVPYEFPTDNASFLHHPLHSKVIMDKATEVNVPTRVYLPTMGINTTLNEGMIDFVVRKLSE